MKENIITEGKIIRMRVYHVILTREDCKFSKISIDLRIINRSNQTIKIKLNRLTDFCEDTLKSINFVLNYSDGTKFSAAYTPYPWKPAENFDYINQCYTEEFQIPENKFLDISITQMKSPKHDFSSLKYIKNWLNEKGLENLSIDGVNLIKGIDTINFVLDNDFRVDYYLDDTLVNLIDSIKFLRKRPPPPRDL